MTAIKNRLYRLATICFTSICLGCASHIVPSDGAITKRYFGWLEVTGSSIQNPDAIATQKAQTFGQIERVKAVGLRLSNGIALGYLDDSTISLPTDCRLVIVVKTIEQIRQIAETLPLLLKTDNLCVKSIDF